MTDAPILNLSHVSKTFVRKPSFFGKLIGEAPLRVHAVSDVSLTLSQGEVLGVVGESGCGKSTLGRMISGIYAPSEGHILLEDKPVVRGSEAHVTKLTPRVQMIHQDPFASLNPRMKIGEILAEGPRAHGITPSGEVKAMVEELLQKVGLDAQYATRFAHQFSGGQRQRIAIARALAMKPALLVLDEAVASLDVSIQAQVLNLFMEIRKELGLSAVFISHDLSVVRHVCDRVAIMYLGRVVEVAPTEELYEAPLHPYTRALFASVPTLGTGKRAFEPIKGEIPSPVNPPKGCHFHPRCPLAGPRCRSEAPRLLPQSPARSVACHLQDGGTEG